MISILYIMVSIFVLGLFVYIRKKELFPDIPTIIFFSILSSIHLSIADANKGDIEYGMRVTPIMQVFASLIIVIFILCGMFCIKKDTVNVDE